jgi:diguanylate cyclase (GGDEF)-like protein
VSVLVEKFRSTAVANRVAFVVLAATALVFVGVALVDVVSIDDGILLIAALGSVLAAAVLDMLRPRLGPVRHLSPVIGLPVIVIPAVERMFAIPTAVGLICLGVFGMMWLLTGRAEVGAYAAGVAAGGGTAYMALHAGLSALDAGPALAAGAGGLGYVLTVIAVEALRRRYDRPAPRVGSTPGYSAVRVIVIALAVAMICALILLRAQLFADLGVNTFPLVANLVPLILLGTVAALIIRAAAMRRRLAGVVDGVNRLNAPSHEQSSSECNADIAAGLGADLGAALLTAVAESVGVESARVRDTPAGPGEIDAPLAVSALGGQYVVARRDVMDVPFTSDDRRALAALARTAEMVFTSRESIGGLTVRANTDPLTGLPNYGAFQEALANINDNRDYSEALAVLFIDLDDFKRMNDRYGHQAGDNVLREFGRRLQNLVRPYDVVARVGGDEFVVILTRLSDLTEATGLAEHLMENAGGPVVVDGAAVNLVLSVGLAFSAHREADVNQLLKDADRSMLAIKKSRGRGGQAKASSINISEHRSSQLNDIVARAIDEDLLELAFQPIVSLVTGQIWAFEALLRYTDPELGPLSPPSVVEKAKSLGRLDALTRQVAVKAMAAAADFRLIEPRIVCMTINIEASQLAAGRMGSFVADLAEQYPGISLCLELNERSVARVSAAVRQQADYLRDMGIMLALDDYGSQDSSVDALVRVPMDILKIDKSLVDDLDDVRQREVLTALQGFGDNLEYSMIVEGVESAEMAAHLSALGIRSAQGFHYGMPLSLEDTLARLEEFGAAAVLPVRAASSLPL